MKNHFARLLNSSDLSRLLLSIYVGVIAKLIFIPIFIPIFYIGRENSRVAVATDYLAAFPMNAGNGGHTWDYNTGEYIDTFLLAPIIENLIFPFIFWVFTKFPHAKYASILTITIIAYFYHQGGIFGLTGATAFCVYAIFYSALQNVTTTWKAYLFTIPAHMTSNVIAFGASFL